MTRVLVVNRDQAVSDRVGSILARAGYEVEHCDGPTADPCPVLDGLPCPLADSADVLVYDAWIGGDADRSHQLVAEVRELYADLPVVLTSVDPSVSWVEIEGAGRVIPLGPSFDEGTLVAAVEQALTEQGMAV